MTYPAIDCVIKILFENSTRYAFSEAFLLS
jgi:hypothetical protein